MTTDSIIKVKIVVDKERAILAGSGVFGAALIEIDLTTLSEEERKLIAKWCFWNKDEFTTSHEMYITGVWSPKKLTCERFRKIYRNLPKYAVDSDPDSEFVFHYKDKHKSIFAKEAIATKDDLLEAVRNADKVGEALLEKYERWEKDLLEAKKTIIDNNEPKRLKNDDDFDKEAEEEVERIVNKFDINISCSSQRPTRNKRSFITKLFSWLSREDDNHVV